MGREATGRGVSGRQGFWGGHKAQTLGPCVSTARRIRTLREEHVQPATERKALVAGNFHECLGLSVWHQREMNLNPLLSATPVPPGYSPSPASFE